MTVAAIRPHNMASANAWNTGGHEYERVSQTIADAIEHCVRCLDPQPGERVLDVATGTGWAARRAAARGAAVVGVDLGPAFDLRFEFGYSVLRAPSAAAVWELFSSAYGPTKTMADSLDPETRERFERDFIAYNEGFMTALGVAMPRDYLLTLGVRK
jgi:SAM-dependent methyltransferase